MTIGICRVGMWMLSALRATLERWFVRRSASASVFGIEVNVETTVPDAQSVFAAMERALMFLQIQHPRHFARVQRVVARFLVRPGRFSEFWKDSRSCILDSELVLSRPPVAVAAVIVHEATHDRLPTFRVGDERRSRVERLCIREEIEIARGQPGSEAYIAWLEDRLRQPQPTDREVERLRLTALADSGAPRWLVRLAGRGRRRRK